MKTVQLITKVRQCTHLNLVDLTHYDSTAPVVLGKAGNEVILDQRASNAP